MYCSVTAVYEAYRDCGRVGHKFQFGEHPDVVGELERGVKELLGLSGHVNWSPSNGEDIDCLQLLLHLVCRSVVQHLTINTQSHIHMWSMMVQHLTINTQSHKHMMVQHLTINTQSHKHMMVQHLTINTQSHKHMMVQYLTPLTHSRMYILRVM